MTPELEKSIKRFSLEIYKIRKGIDTIISEKKEISVDELSKINSLLTKIDKDLLKESGIKFTENTKKDIVDLIG